MANLLNVGWDLVKDIDKTNLKKIAKAPLKDLKKIAIDKIYPGKKNKFITLVPDIDTGSIVYIGDGKETKSLVAFWKILKRAYTHIEAMTSYMSPAYAKAILKIFLSLFTCQIDFML